MISSGSIGLPGLAAEGPIVLRTNGVGPTPTPDPLETVYDCSASYLAYINCAPWLANVPGDGDYKKTVVVFDSGLTASQWASIQMEESNNYGADIISYWTEDPDTGEIVAYGGEGPETTDYLSDIADKLSPEGVSHGYYVISALMTIARGSKIIVVDIATDSNPESNTDPVGLRYSDIDLWNWLSSNVTKFNIGVFTTSLEFPSLTQTMFDSISSLYSQQVFMITATGNIGRDESSTVPNNLVQFFPVSSIDHENRGKWRSIGGINYFDPYYYSSVGHLSGDTEYGRANCPTSVILCSSWGSDIRPVRFAMPGHFITLPTEFIQGRRYPVALMGTSVSAPLLAGAALVAIHAYAKGYLDANGLIYNVPTRQKLVEMLEAAASQSATPDRYLGAGYVNIGDLYDIA